MPVKGEVEAAIRYTGLVQLSGANGLITFNPLTCLKSSTSRVTKGKIVEECRGGDKTQSPSFIRPEQNKPPRLLGR